MNTYSGTYSGSSPIVPVFLICGMVVIAALLLLSMMGGAAVQVAPKPTPERVGGIDIDKAVEEAKLVIKDLVPGGEVGELVHSTGGFLRVYMGWKGALYVVGHNEAPGLLAAAEKIAEQLGATVGPW